MESSSLPSTTFSISDWFGIQNESEQNDISPLSPSHIPPSSASSSSLNREESTSVFCLIALFILLVSLYLLFFVSPLFWHVLVGSITRGSFPTAAFPSTQPGISIVLLTIWGFVGLFLAFVLSVLFIPHLQFHCPIFSFRNGSCHSWMGRFHILCNVLFLEHLRACITILYLLVSLFSSANFNLFTPDEDGPGYIFEWIIIITSFDAFLYDIFLLMSRILDRETFLRHIIMEERDAFEKILSDDDQTIIAGTRNNELHISSFPTINPSDRVAETRYVPLTSLDEETSTDAATSSDSPVS